MRAVSPSLTTSSLTLDGFSWSKNIAPQRRARYGQPAQKPLNGCPQISDYPRIDCGLCGGEDPLHSGLCSKPTRTGGWRCACMYSASTLSLCTRQRLTQLLGDPGPPPSPVTTTVVIATVGTDVATGTYELETLTQYSKLREHITVMTTTTGQNSGCKLKVPSILGTELYADAEPGGCDETECPVDGADNQPDCSDETGCAGQNGQCTAGEFEGCNCKETECPDLDEHTFWCNSDCGGNDGTGKCKGASETIPEVLCVKCLILVKLYVGSRPRSSIPLERLPL